MSDQNKEFYLFRNQSYFVCPIIQINIPLPYISDNAFCKQTKLTFDSIESKNTRSKFMRLR